MVGKLIGALGALAIALLFSLPAEFALALVALGVVAGHLALDALPAVKRPPRDPAVEALLAKPRLKPRITQVSDAERQQIALLCPMFIEYARVDGAVVQAEVRAIKEYFEVTLRYSETHLELVRQALKQSLAGPTKDLAELAKAARPSVAPPDRPGLLRAIYQLALSDSDIRRSEVDALRAIVQQFNLSEEQLQSITKEFFGTGEAHFQALGLPTTATDDEIRSAFRKLAAENHPDRVASLGPQEAEAAAARFRTVKDAYEELKKLRGL